MKSLLLILLIVSSYANEIKNVVGVSERYDGGTEENCKGFYWEVSKEVFALSNINLICKLAPYQRAVKLVETNNADFWVGSYIDEENFAYYPKINMDADIVSVLFDSTKNKFNNINDLKNKKVGWINGYDYDDYIDVSMDKKELRNKIAAIKMVKYGRLDYLMEDSLELELSLKKMKFDKSNLVVKKIMELKTYLAFNKTKRGKELAKIWDTNIKKLHESGKLKKMYDKSDYANIYPFKN